MASTRPEPHRAAIYSTAFTAFFAIAGIAVVDPILPVIGAEIGASTWQIELLFTAYIAVMALGMIPAGVKVYLASQAAAPYPSERGRLVKRSAA